MRKLAIIVALTVLSANTLSAKTLILEGELESVILLTQQIGFAVDKPVDTLSFRFALPTTFANRGVVQDVKKLTLKFDPEPAEVADETDSFGNSYKKVTWNRLKRDALIKLEFETHVKSALSAMASAAAFPLKNIPFDERRFLKATPMVQAEDREIIDLAKSLTSGAATEYQAVSSVMNFIADNIKYAYNPLKYDALDTLNNRSGNCQNFAHLSMALLRAAGIPARIVGGISLKQQWKVPIDAERSVVQGMGQGGHAWMEIYFPDLGWLSYDPQQSKQFTSSRHIKQTHGLDSQDINDTWRAAPYLPQYSESIDAQFLNDRVEVKLKSADEEPRPYLISSAMTMKQGAATVTAPLPQPPLPVLPQPPVVTPTPAVTPKTPQPPPAEPAKPPPAEPAKPPPAKPEAKKPSPPPAKKPHPVKKPDSVNVVEFGNMEFPNLVDTFRATGMSGMRILDKETSEYVTSSHVYAQALQVDNDMALDKVSLAMHKFGGDGTIYLDFVADDNGKPGFAGLRSQPLFLDRVSRKPGYSWVDFSYSDESGRPLVKKGKYWIVLRHSGDAILTWFYIPGKPYSRGDDTRSTAKGYKWEDILNYDFVFKVRGLSKTAKADR
jgi:transglutaminase-like putative cysteine protease